MICGYDTRYGMMYDMRYDKRYDMRNLRLPGIFNELMVGSVNKTPLYL